MEHDDRHGTSDVWHPSTDHLLHSRILGFARDQGAADVRALVRRADADPAWFWGEVAEWLGLDWQRTPSRVVDGLADGHSPDRVDALVWAVTELMLRDAPRVRGL